jgi:predicted O-linked N-acetylglucosamine transferase (SPINDLY family)
MIDHAHSPVDQLQADDPMTAGREALMRGDGMAAVEHFHTQMQRSPHEAEAHYWLGSALLAVGEDAAAEQVLADARSYHAVPVMRSLGVDMGRFRDDAAYVAAIGHQLYGARMVGLASVALARAMSLGEITADLLLRYGLSLQHQGRAEESIRMLQAAADSFPSAGMHEYLLYALFYGEDGCNRYAAEARRWAAMWAPISAPRPPVRKPGPCLRVGYLAPSFTRSQLRQFVMPVLEAHDPKAVKLYLYSADAAAEDALPKSATVRSIGKLADGEAAALIRSDRLDLLIDLWGHTAGSRLTLFTHRPAPVQAGFVNFNQTTGLDCVDYVLHSDSMEAPGSDQLFTETVWRLGPITVPFLCQAGRPPTPPTPARRNGYITFGSFNHPAKISPQTVKGWSAILRAHPTSRLVLKYGYFEDPVLQRATQARFAAFGVEPGRIEFRGHTTGEAYLAEFADIDLALDPSPCTGGTTTCEALSNGVPVLTLKGEDFFSRIGLQCLYGVDAPQLIAESWDDYIAIAGKVTADLDALDALRLHVRERFENGPYGDFAGFTRSLEDQYRQMIQRLVERDAA